MNAHRLNRHTHTVRTLVVVNKMPKGSKKIQTTNLEVMITLENAYMEAGPWFRNTGQHKAAEWSGTPAKSFWDRQRTLINHKVTYKK